jgi:phage/plasmid-associated DNA primase
VCFSFDIQTDKKIFGENFIRITGGDPVTTRRLYHEVESRVIPTVRFMGSMNLDMPKFIAAPDALERRLILLPCGELIQNPDLNRFEKINAERAGILARWVRALNRLYRRGHFDIPKEAVSELEDYIHDQDPFDLYVMERLSDDPNAQTPVAEITRDFNLWAGEMGASELQVNVIGRKLRQAGFNGGYTRAGTPHTQRIVRARIGRKLDLSKNIF